MELNVHHSFLSLLESLLPSWFIILLKKKLKRLFEKKNDFRSNLTGFIIFTLLYCYYFYLRIYVNAFPNFMKARHFWLFVEYQLNHLRMETEFV